jgi:arylsulfatase A
VHEDVNEFQRGGVTSEGRIEMTMQRLFMFAVAVCSCGFGSADSFAESELPNIVYILADDLGYGDVSCYNPESKIATPHVDRLAAEGMRFTDAHTPSAVCTPTRYGILTGRYAWRTRMKFRVLDGFDPPLIEAGRLTVPALLKQHGYATACVGKWHLGMQWTDKSGKPVPYIPVETKGRPQGQRAYWDSGEE